MIRCILFDVDDTLMDYHEAETAIFRRLFAEQGRAIDAPALDDLWEKSWLFWNGRGLDRPGREDVRQTYHERSRQAVEDLCAYAREKYGLAASPAALGRRFAALMAEAVTLYDDALPALRALHGRFALCAASNALTESQRPRLRSLEGLLDHVFLSEEMGLVKPDPAFFAHAARAAGARPDECLMVGDSLVSDIAGAASAGMHTCWLNRAGRALSGGTLPESEVRSLRELVNLPLLSDPKKRRNLP